MKIVLLLALVVALCHGFSQNCPAKSRDEKKLRYNQPVIKHCKNPTETLVQLKVPDGYDYLKPSVVMINQCPGLPCSINHKKKCVAKMSRPRFLQVEAYTSGTFMCVNVTVQEHLDCGCSCYENNCETNKIPDEVTCSCVCDPSLKRQCGAMHKWSENGCACVCPRRIDCDDSMEWNHGLCRCDYK